MPRWPLRSSLAMALCAVARCDGGPSCVQSVSGTMLCCGAGDQECFRKQREAHPTDQDKEHIRPEAPPRPWYAGVSTTFSRLPHWEGGNFDICVVGVPYSLAGAGSELAPAAVRMASRRLQPYHRGFKQALNERAYHVVDADDIVVNRFDIRAAARELEGSLGSVLSAGRGCVVIGGDHGITYGLMRATQARFGSFALVHLDAHLDAHGTPLRWSVSQNLLDVRHSIHVGIRGTTASAQDDLADGELGFETLTMRAASKAGPEGVVKRILQRLLRRDGTYMNYFVLLDMDVLDPAFAPGVAHPEIGGFTIVELQAIIEGLQEHGSMIGAAVVGAAPENDPTRMTGLVTASFTNDLLHLMTKGPGGVIVSPPPLPMPEEKGQKGSEL